MKFRFLNLCTTLVCVLLVLASCVGPANTKEGSTDTAAVPKGEVTPLVSTTEEPPFPEEDTCTEENAPTDTKNTEDKGVTYAKPVLYLYPEKECEIRVSLLHGDRVTVSYPKYEKDGWTVTAQPDGTLTDGARSYYCLYWEEDCIYASAFDEGFCVAGKDSAAFLEDALARLGLSEREANECIIYWLPILEQSAYNIISFECTEEREKKSPLLISPAPDTLIRIALHIRPTDTFVSIPTQKLCAPERIGFVAVEWGGVIYTDK